MKLNLKYSQMYIALTAKLLFEAKMDGEELILTGKCEKCSGSVARLIE
ncbi:hypothetical protein [Sulfurimonas sp. NW9]